MRTIAIILFNLSSLIVFAQSDKLTLDQTLGVALRNNKGIQAASYEVEYQKQLKKTSFDLPKTDITLMRGQYNSYAKNDNNITVLQTIPFAALGSQGSLNRSLMASAELKKAATENELVYQVKQVYYQLAFTQSRHDLLLQQDSIYEGFFKAASLRYKTGETNLLEKTTAETQSNEVKNQLRQNEATALVLRTQLKTLMNSDVLPDIAENAFSEIEISESPDSAALVSNPSLAFMRQQVEVAKSQKKVESAKFAPDLLVGFFSQTLIGATNSENGAIATSNDRFNGFQVGISIPLWFVPHQGRVKAAAYNQQAAQSNYEYHQITLNGQMDQALQQYAKNKSSLEYYRTSALPNADLILRQSLTAFRSGEIGYAEYLIGVRNGISIKEGFLQTLNEYNQSIIYIEFLSGNK
jgi:cobalt-zinc-cadmium resistance protein CzcA